ncbi:hypothetical protein FNU79_04150 [Deinococcus detaillensis]|uniref:Uncharacterized protein n=1 Tax=Deinococcus detaillensis TaxID=2592048 RepID=A0A553V3R8_9DEIO|nr:hypothetical protein [Deinococcus detaillensis]TSA87097.1 hypothetical protein FNU79_04150 [Deinococcus detaillensis]
MKKLLLIGAFLLTPLIVSGCPNCIDSGMCPFVINGPTQPSGPYKAVTLARGSTTQIDLALDTTGVPTSATFELFAKQAEAKAQSDANILFVADSGNVVIRRTTSTFTGSTASVSVIVGANASLTTNQLISGSFGIRRIGSAGIGGNVLLSIKVVPSL